MINDSITPNAKDDILIMTGRPCIWQMEYYR